MTTRFALALVASVLFVLPAPAQEPVDLDVVTRIRAEGFKQSQVMDTVWHLTDLYGPRLTNSPQQRKAAEWARDRLAEYGLANATLEPWGEFGQGWSFEKCQVAMTEPIYMPLIALPKAWTPGTAGEVTGQPILIEVETVLDLEQYAGKLAGKIVLNGKVSEVESPFEALATRYDADDLAELARAPELEQQGGGGDSSRSDWRARRAVREKLNEMLRSEGALVVIEPDGGRRNDYGVITLGSGGPRDPQEEQALPQVVVSTEQFNRIARLLRREQPVSMSVDVRCTFHTGDLVGRNVVAEIPGSELAHEVVMLGAHFDSWHPATGATDNGAQCAVMMEAMRILKALEVRPLRTIRIGLWTGEEQGLLGSRGYVTNHFGDRETMQLLPGHADFAAYFNLDNGSGKIRGVYAQENVAAAAVFEAWLRPFHDLGATSVVTRDTGGTDHTSFDRVGLPGFQFIQDGLDYFSRTHHTNVDTLDHTVREDLVQASVVMASFLFHAANRDEPLPRKPMPRYGPRE